MSPQGAGSSVIFQELASLLLDLRLALAPDAMR